MIINYKSKVSEYYEANCGAGKYYPNPETLLNMLRKTRRPVWAGIPVIEFTANLEVILASENKPTQEKK